MKQRGDADSSLLLYSLPKWPTSGRKQVSTRSGDSQALNTCILAFDVLLSVILTAVWRQRGEKRGRQWPGGQIWTACLRLQGLSQLRKLSWAILRKLQQFATLVIAMEDCCS